MKIANIDREILHISWTKFSLIFLKENNGLYKNVDIVLENMSNEVLSFSDNDSDKKNENSESLDKKNTH